MSRGNVAVTVVGVVAGVAAFALSFASPLRTALGIFDKGPWPTVQAPEGMKSDGFRNFGFAIPAEWRPSADLHDPAWEDSSGELTMASSQSTILDCPKDPSSTVVDDGETVVSEDPIEVPGAGGAWRYSLTGTPRGDETRVYVWLPSCEDSLTLRIYAPASTADKIIASLVAEDEDH